MFERKIRDTWSVTTLSGGEALRARTSRSRTFCRNRSPSMTTRPRSLSMIELIDGPATVLSRSATTARSSGMTSIGKVAKGTAAVTCLSAAAVESIEPSACLAASGSATVASDSRNRAMPRSAASE